MNFPDHESGGETKPFVKLKDKESIKLILTGDPKIFHTHWVGATTSICPGRDVCDVCAGGQKNTFRVRWNAYVNVDGAYVAKVFEQGWTMYNQLKDLNVEYPLEKTVIKISRSGSGKNDTTYSVFPVPNGTVTPELQSKLAKVPLVDLSPYPKEGALKSEPATNGAHSNARSDGPPEHAFTEDDIPF